MAEDVVQETLIKALNVWKIKGIPDNPTAWLFRVARNHAIDVLRKNKQTQQLDLEQPLLHSEYTLNQSLNGLFNQESVTDNQLKMMYVCCNPVLSPESQISLVLKTLCGFSIKEIAQALLSKEEAVSKRIRRAKETFRKEKIAFQLPDNEQLKDRTAKVLNAIYLLFNQGYHSNSGNELIRKDLIQESISLAKLVADNPATSNTEAYALLALMCFHVAREQSRVNEQGDIILLENQNRALWDSELIQIATNYLNKASEGESISSYHLEAAIAFEHCAAPTYAKTNWPHILHYYNLLLKANPSPILELNRAVVINELSGPDSALAALNKIKGLDDHYLFHSFLGNIFRDLNEPLKAKKAYLKAMALTPSESEKKMLSKRLENLSF